MPDIDWGNAEAVAPTSSQASSVRSAAKPPPKCTGSGGEARLAQSGLSPARMRGLEPGIDA